MTEFEPIVGQTQSREDSGLYIKTPDGLKRIGNKDTPVRELILRSGLFKAMMESMDSDNLQPE